MNYQPNSNFIYQCKKNDLVHQFITLYICLLKICSRTFHQKMDLMGRQVLNHSKSSIVHPSFVDMYMICVKLYVLFCLMQ